MSELSERETTAKSLGRKAQGPQEAKDVHSSKLEGLRFTEDLPDLSDQPSNNVLPVSFYAQHETTILSSPHFGRSKLPLTSATTIVVVSCCKTLNGRYRDPTNIMVLVVEGKFLEGC